MKKKKNTTKQVLQNILRSRLPVSASSTIVCKLKIYILLKTEQCSPTTVPSITIYQHDVHLQVTNVFSSNKIFHSFTYAISPQYEYSFVPWIYEKAILNLVMGTFL